MACADSPVCGPYLRKFQLYTVGDFLALRYPGHDKGRWVRLVSVLATLCISFVYVVAQIYAVGLITSRFVGVEFGIGVFFGLAAILVCSFLGGMRAVTWTQVAQYLVMIVAMSITTVVLFVVAQGAIQSGVSDINLVQYVQLREQQIAENPAEQQVRHAYLQEAQHYQSLIKNLPASWAEGYEARRQALEASRYNGAPFQAIKQAEQALESYPATPLAAKKLWANLQAEYVLRQKPVPPHFDVQQSTLAEPASALRFFAIAFTLMCGTVALPHLIVRFLPRPMHHKPGGLWCMPWALFWCSTSWRPGWRWC
ncbi:MAG: hypothetical protein HC848_06060 [Limnobacter sp.]|nr:hypothetical protein [Limnobacter sp.]